MVGVPACASPVLRRGVASILALGHDPIMDNLSHFIQYATAFEQAYADDDWSRLIPYFADDAVYRVVSDVFGCELRGPEAILRGIQKSVNGFDRRFATRQIEVTSGPEVEGDTVRLGWSVTYTLEGVEPFVLPGRSRARLRDGKLVELEDAYDASTMQAAAEWQHANGMTFDPSYV